MQRRGRVGVLVVVCLAACGGERAAVPDAGDVGVPDAGSSAPDAPPDGAPSPPPPPLFGGDPAWVVSVPGAGEPSELATTATGEVFLVARHASAVQLGRVSLPAPGPSGALLVLKLSAAGEALWGRSFAGRLEVTGAAVGPGGELAFGGGYHDAPASLALAPSAGGADAYVAVLDGDTGALRWSTSFGGPAFEYVGDVAFGAEELYVLADLFADLAIDGTTYRAGAVLARYALDGARGWRHGLANLHTASGPSLVVDPERGPVISGRFEPRLDIGDRVLEPDQPDWDPRDRAIAAFDRDGGVRFVHQVHSSYDAEGVQLAIDDDGALTVATDARGITALADRVLRLGTLGGGAFALRMSPDGVPGTARTLGAGWGFVLRDTAADAGGAYLAAVCGGLVEVQPAVTCTTGDSLVVALAHDGEQRWVTRFERAEVSAAAAAPGSRLIVTGDTLGPLRINGQPFANQGLFVAALASGPARVPDPLPAAPEIASTQVVDVSDRQIRQGGSGTLVIEGTGLDAVRSVRLGDLFVHIPPAAATPTRLRLPLAIPHGMPPGPLAVRLISPGGEAAAPAVVEVTPVTVAPLGRDAGRGTPSSPLALCRDEWESVLAHGDTLALEAGRFSCPLRHSIPAGVTMRGAGRERTKLGAPATARGLYLRSGTSGVPGVTVIEDLALERAGESSAAITVAGRAAIRRVDLIDSAGMGIWATMDSDVTLDDVREIAAPSSSETSLYVASRATVQARDLELRRSVHVHGGKLYLEDATLKAPLIVGDFGVPGVRSSATLVRTTVVAPSAIEGAYAQITLIDSEVRATGESWNGFGGISLMSGSLVLRRTAVVGWPDYAIRAANAFGDPDVGLAVGDEVDVSIDISIDDSLIEGTLDLASTSQDRMKLRNTRVRGDLLPALQLYGDGAIVDLGTPSDPGANQLTQLGGGVALEDRRDSHSLPADAHGTTLNGASFSGAVTGPVEVPGAYRITQASTIRF